MSRRVLALLLIAAASVACDETTEPLLPCDDGVFPTATSGTTPDFSWTPGCLAAALEVRDVATGTLQWSIEAATSIITPEIGYGEVPANVTETTAPATLVAGTQYAVGIFRRNISGSIDNIGAVIFTP